MNTIQIRASKTTQTALQLQITGQSQEIFRVYPDGRIFERSEDITGNPEKLREVLLQTAALLSRTS